MALIYRILVLLFLVFYKLRIKQTARFGNPFGLQTSLIFLWACFATDPFVYYYLRCWHIVKLHQLVAAVDYYKLALAIAGRIGRQVDHCSV